MELLFYGQDDGESTETETSKKNDMKKMLLHNINVITIFWAFIFTRFYMYYSVFNNHLEST